MYTLLDCDKSFENKKKVKDCVCRIRFKQAQERPQLSNEKDEHSTRKMEGKNVPDQGVESVTDELRYPCPIICAVVFFHKIFKKVLKCHAIKFKARKHCLTAEEKHRNRVYDQTSLWPDGVSSLWLGRCQDGCDSSRLRGGLWTRVVRGQ